MVAEDRAAAVARRLSSAEIAALWLSQGGDPSKVAEAVAVVKCESGGDPGIRPNSAGARGLWQFIPSTLPSDECAMSAVCSTREAIKLSKNGKTWAAWDCHPDAVGRTGWSTGHRNYDPEGAAREIANAGLDSPRRLARLAKRADATIINPLLPFLNPSDEKVPLVPDLGDLAEGVGGLIPDAITNAFEAIGRVFVSIGELLFTPEGWLRLGKIIGGVILVLWGLNTLIKFTTGSSPAGMLPAGRVAKAVKG